STAPSWQFIGAVGVAVQNLATRSGADVASGAYSEIAFDFRTDAQRHAAIRLYYGSPAVVFTVSLPDGGPHTLNFPTFPAYPKNLNRIAYSGTFAYPTFHGWSDDSPWISFDGSMNTAILSPASHFMVARTSVQQSGELVSGISTKIPSLPAGFSH